MTDHLTANARYRELKDVGQLTSTGASVELVEGEAVVVCRWGLLVGARMHEDRETKTGLGH
jgi:hypothetical protein